MHLYAHLAVLVIVVVHRCCSRVGLLMVPLGNLNSILCNHGYLTTGKMISGQIQLESSEAHVLSLQCLQQWEPVLKFGGVIKVNG